MSIYNFINKYLFTYLKVKFMKIYLHVKYFKIILGPICMKLQKMIKDGVYVSKLVKLTNGSNMFGEFLLPNKIHLGKNF